MELPSIQSILSKYNEAESRHILNNFPLASLFTRKEKSDNKKLIECYPDSVMGFPVPGGLCYGCHYILDIAKFNKKYPNVRDHMEMFGKSMAIELGSKVDVSVGRALDNNTKQKSLAKAFDFDEDEVVDAAESIIWEMAESVVSQKEMLGQNHLIGIVPDELMHEVGLLEIVKGFYRGEKAVNSWDLGRQIINQRALNVHWYSSSFVDRVYILDKNAIEIVFSRLPPALPFPSDVFVDKESGFSKRKMYAKMYATNFCQPQKALKDDMQFCVYADFSRIRSFSCTS